MFHTFVVGLREAWWVIVLPTCVGVILTTLRAVANRSGFTNETSIDAALDVTFLALGASGGALIKPSVALIMHGYFAEFVGLFLVITLGTSAFLLYQRTFFTVVSDKQRNWNLLLAAMVCSLVVIVAYLGGIA